MVSSYSKQLRGIGWVVRVRAAVTLQGPRGVGEVRASQAPPAQHVHVCAARVRGACRVMADPGQLVEYSTPDLAHLKRADYEFGACSCSPSASSFGRPARWLAIA